MIAIKQSLLVKKVNTRDLETTIKQNTKELLGWRKSDCEFGTIKLGLALSLLIIRNIKLKKYRVITLGASNKDVVAIEKDLSEHRYHFEYIMEVSAETFGNKTVAAIIKDFEKGNINEAIKVINSVGRCAMHKQNLIVDKQSFAIKTSEHQDIPTIILTKEWESPLAEELSDIHLELESYGRPGKLKLIHVIACTRKESELITEIGDTDLATMVCISMFLNNNTEFKAFSQECFNFANILPADKFENDKVKKLKIKKDKSGLPLITDYKTFNKIMEALYN